MARSYAADLKRGRATSSLPALQSRLRPEPETSRVIVYTSGTTGASKGAMLSHGNLAAIVTALIVGVALASGPTCCWSRCRSFTCTD